MANDKIGFVEGIAGFVKVHKPYPKYQSDDTEFSIDVVVDKAQAKKWKAEFKKQAPKEMDNDEFEKVYKISAPFPDQDEQFIIKLKTPATYKDGGVKEKKYWPRVLIQDGDEALPIEEDTLLGNGSSVKVSYNVTSNDFGTFAKLKNILCTDLIAYESSGGGGGGEFGLKVKSAPSEFNEDNSEDSPPEEDKPKQQKGAPKKSKKPPVEDDLDDVDLPF